jgi:hypothetical protein
MVKTYKVTKRAYNKKTGITKVFGYRLTKRSKKAKKHSSHLILGYKGK